MIDIHCHIMPGVDDGSKNLEESLAIFENAATSGITDIILTPHYIKGTRYQYDNENKEKLAEILREALRRAELDINVYIGNEIYIDESVPKLLDEHKIATLAGSRYILIELPVNSEFHSAPELIFKLISSDFIPVIAHPERYIYFQKHPEKVDRYIELGCLMQGNYMSLLGKYGKKAKSTLKYLLQERKIDLLASDIHHSYHEYRLPEAEKKVLRIVRDKDLVQKLFIENPEKIIKNQEI